jgi:hypothetical protein
VKLKEDFLDKGICRFQGLAWELIRQFTLRGGAKGQSGPVTQGASEFTLIGLPCQAHPVVNELLVYFRSTEAE